MRGGEVIRLALYVSDQTVYLIITPIFTAANEELFKSFGLALFNKLRLIIGLFYTVRRPIFPKPLFCSCERRLALYQTNASSCCARSHWVNGGCPRSVCKFGHNLHSLHNTAVLRRHRMEEEGAAAVRALLTQKYAALAPKVGQTTDVYSYICLCRVLDNFVQTMYLSLPIPTYNVVSSTNILLAVYVYCMRVWVPLARSFCPLAMWSPLIR